MKKGVKVFIVILLITIIIAVITIVCNKDDTELKTVKSKQELLKIYEGDNSDLQRLLARIFCMPFSMFYHNYDVIGKADNAGSIGIDSASSTESSSSSSNTKDYSTTNIQVENVDEADIVKTDGDYIYSISEDNVIITDVKDPKQPKVVATIKSEDDDIPEDIILYKDKLVVISTKGNQTQRYYYNNRMNTVVKIYNITSREKPVLTKSYEMYEPYYTSRCIDNVLYVISSGNLRKEDDKIVVGYNEDNMEKEMSIDKIKYLKDVKTTKQTLISTVDLNNETADIKLDSYLMNISNAYVSENAIYLLNQKYNNDSKIPIKLLFGFKGVFGLEDYYEMDSESGYYTEIYKFDIKENVEYKAKTKVKGKTINQYSLDEKDNHLRIALYDNDGSRVAIFDEDLKQIGISDNVAKGEKMYSSRFIGDKVYFVTYKTIDPLFVMDLSNEAKPKVLGKLKIPGYSTYLHPYDENHIIGIGMETKEIINRNSNGKVISTTAKVVGMKMALFDVSNVNSPVQISSVVIGDSRTTSAILTNPKALLFSKEKSLIAIPVNNYSQDFEVTLSNNYETMINNYTKYSKPYNAEGYFVYNINVQDGFKLKGVITHEKTNATYYYSNSKLLRGLYIDNNLYTVSETMIKVNELDSLKAVGELKLKNTENVDSSVREQSNNVINAIEGGM
ncbi:MAG: beta-propeller domain-containing protein [Clostridia bacterium]|jgi:inhibitor of cysteine peptidase|nr:beta-propeller domain-containing protein [Clostridia bacterium]